MVSLSELKSSIETNTLDRHLLVFKCANNSDFIAYQYASEFVKNNDYSIKRVDGVEDFPRRGLWDREITPELIVYVVQTLNEDLPIEQDEIATNYVWVICNKIASKQKKKYEDFIVDVPKLEEWQIREYVMSICPFMEESEVDEILSYYGNNLFRLDIELSKIAEVKNYERVRPQLYTDVSNFNAFDLVNAIVRRDMVALSNVYAELDLIDVDPFGLVALLINNFRHVIDIQLAKNPTAESVGVSSKQFWAIKNYSCGHYSKDELIKTFKMLTSIDYMVKSGYLTTDMIIDYIIGEVMAV